MQRAIFLDRDGVINRATIRNGKPFPPHNLAAVEILPGVAEAMEALHKAAWVLIVITNQPDVSRGTAVLADVIAINDYLKATLPINEFRTCYHDDNDKCDCRKPLPGSLLAAAHAHDINLAESYMVGDRWRDIEAGQRAGCKTIFIDYGYAEKQPTNFNHRVQSLLEAAHIILGRPHEKSSRS